MDSVSREPLVTAIIATYNRGYIVCEAIDSMLHQTYPNIEIIVVDDGSTDDTQEKLKKYGDKISVVYQKNAGPAAAWNTGIAASRGDIVSFLGSDDIWLPAYVNRQVSLLRRVGPSVPCSLTNGELRLADGRKNYSFDFAALFPPLEEGLWRNVTDVLLTRFVMGCQMLAVRRGALDKAGTFDPALRFMEDYDFALRLSLQGPWAFIREPLVVYRQSPKCDSLSLSISSRDARLHELTLSILRNLRDNLEGQERSLSSPYLAARIRKVGRDLWATRSPGRNPSTKLLLLKLNKLVERADWIWCRQSPALPKMNTVPVPAKNIGWGSDVPDPRFAGRAT